MEQVVFIVTHRPHKFWGESMVRGEDYNKRYLDGICSSIEEANKLKSKLPKESYKYIEEVINKTKTETIRKEN